MVFERGWKLEAGGDFSVKTEGNTALHFSKTLEESWGEAVSLGFRNIDKGKPGQLTLDRVDDARAADFLVTPYWVVKILLTARQDLAGQLAVEPCAGNGALIRHAEMAADRLKIPRVIWGAAVEIRDESEALQRAMRSEKRVWSPQDVTSIDDNEPIAGPEIKLAWTNLPWFNGVIPVCKAVWRLWPNAHLWGLCSTFFYLQTTKEARATFMQEHRPQEILHLPRRVRFEGQKSEYNFPVAWHHWLPEGQRGAGIWNMLQDSES